MLAYLNITDLLNIPLKKIFFFQLCSKHRFYVFANDSGELYAVHVYTQVAYRSYMYSFMYYVRTNAFFTAYQYSQTLVALTRIFKKKQRLH